MIAQDSFALGLVRSVALIALALLAVSGGMLSSVAHAQGGRSNDNILYPRRPLPLYIGPEAGYAMWDVDASFVVGDGALACAAFGDGEGAGPTVGMRSHIYLTPWVFLSPRLRYEPRLLKFVTALEPEPVRDSRDSIVMLSREGRADATTSTFTLDLRVGLDLFESGFYLSAGPSASMVASNFYDYSERITGPAGIVQRTGEQEQMLASSRAFDNREMFTLDARAGAGLMITFGRWMINPEAGYTYPITSSLATPDTMKQRGFSGSLGILFNIGEQP